MNAAPTLLVLAAGMGSRYGGLKQVDSMGPNGETVLDYAIHDALKAGFERVVFVIRRDMETAFRSAVGDRYAGRIPVAYAYQDLDDLPEGFSPPDGRVKPWGTGHALRAARHAIDGHFAVINADDFYGADAYTILADYFAKCLEEDREPFCMVGYPLAHTLSDHGAVNRGLCREESGQLQAIEEVTGIRRGEDGLIRGTSRDGNEGILREDALVSMNFWGFSSAIFKPLEERFVEFLKDQAGGQKTEFYIPSFVDLLIHEEGCRCDLLRTRGDWFGVTYPEDKPAVQKRLEELVEAGTYPSPIMPAKGK